MWLGALPIVPGNSPAPVMAASAADCVRFVTLGTVTSGGGPDEMTRLTLVPPDTFVLATGFWLITSPAATVVLEAVVIAPTLSPTAVICAVAALCVSPTVCGYGHAARDDEAHGATGRRLASAGGILADHRNRSGPLRSGRSSRFRRQAPLR